MRRLMMTNASAAANARHATTVPAIAPFDIPVAPPDEAGGGGVGRRLRGVNGPNVVRTESKVMVSPSRDMVWSSGMTCSVSRRNVWPALKVRGAVCQVMIRWGERISHTRTHTHTHTHKR